MSTISKCEKCGIEFKDDTPDTPLILCPECEVMLRLQIQQESPHLSSDGGFGPRGDYGKKIGGPRLNTDPDVDANKSSD